MIDTEIEKFTATGAVEEGLIDAIKRGETIVEGYYEISQDGYLTFKQRNFTFTDKHGGLRVGKFADIYQLRSFFEEFSKLHEFENNN